MVRDNMNKMDYLASITAFNSDKEIIALREKYKEPTFFEIISKQRSETTYSSFLKWMFQSSSTDLNSVSPILLLLDILVTRCEEQKRKDNEVQEIVHIDDEFKRDVVTRNFQINSIEVETEKSVGRLVDELKDKWKSCDILKKEDEEKLIQKCQDRIDIFIKCHLDNNQELQIIIENKIDSTEGGGKNNPKTGVGEYDESDQTKRYYIATKRDETDRLKQLYIYLSPSVDNECDCKSFIRITYQDIIDGIIVPMLSTTSLSSRARFFLEELKTELTFPSLEGRNMKSSIAISNENSEKFGNIWKKHGQLIIDAAVATSESNIWYIARPKNICYYDYPPTQELLEYLPKETKKTLSRKPQYRTVLKVIESNNELYSGQYKIDKDLELLNMFWDNNKRFLLALMNGLPDEERKKIECLSAEVSKRDNTKYFVYYDGQCLNPDYLGKEDKAANNSETAWMIIDQWAQTQEEITLELLRNKFKASECNKYYEKGFYLKNLFYQYRTNGEYIVDGSRFEGQIAEAGGWDFYKPKNKEDRKFRIRMSNGEDAIMLKVWRKSELNRLIEWVTKEKYFGDKELSVQPNR